MVHPDASMHFKEWREGRRIVELGVLADGLKACTECGLPLQLGHTTSIQNFGLSAILKVIYIHIFVTSLMASTSKMYTRVN